MQVLTLVQLPKRLANLTLERQARHFTRGPIYIVRRPAAQLGQTDMKTVSQSISSSVGR